MIFIRSILSSAQTSGHRLTQTPLTNPQLSTQTRAHTLFSPIHNNKRARIFFSRALGVLTGLYWLTRRNTTRTRLLIILFWLAFIAQYKEWKGPNVAVSIPSYRKGRGQSTHCCPHLVMIANMLQLKKNLKITDLLVNVILYEWLFLYLHACLTLWKRAE